MRNPAKPMLICLFSLLSLQPVLAGDLKTLSDVYQKSAEDIRQSFQPKFDDLQTKYQKSLETLKANAQGQGDFETTKAAKTEIERFQKSKSLPPVTDENEIPEIKAFQAAYVTQFTKLETEEAANLGALSKQPKLLYFESHLQYWADHAAEWKARGFAGAFVPNIAEYYKTSASREVVKMGK